MKLMSGAVSGLFATGAMSSVLGVSAAAGIMKEQPPRRIVAALLPVRDTSRLTKALGVVAHLGYGTAAGAAFALLPPPLPNKLLAGTTYGALVYTAGYEGWLPMLGILPPAHRDHRGRVATMVLAHLVYGGSLAYAHGKLTGRRDGNGSTGG